MATLLEHPNSSFTLGSNDSAAATAYRRGEAALIENMRISPEGTAEVRYGNQRSHSAALAGESFGITVFLTADGTEYWVGGFGDTMYYSLDYGVNWTSIATGLRQDYWCFATMRVGATNYLLCVNGGTNGYKWDGTTWGTISNLPANVTWIQVYNGRLWACGHNGSIVQASRIADFETWSGAYAITVQVQTHDGDNDVIALFQVGPELLVFKRNSTSTIFGFGEQDIVVAASAVGISRSVGCVAPRTIQAAGDQGCMWLSSRGLEFYQRGSGLRSVSRSMRRFFGETVIWADFLGTGNSMLPCAAYIPKSGTEEYLLAVPALVGGVNDYIVRAHLALPTPEGGFAITLDPYEPSSATGGTLYVDANGSLSLSLNQDQSRVRTIGGSLTLASDTEPGAYIDTDEDSLTITSVGYGLSTLFVADRPGEENTEPNVGCSDGYVRYLNYGTVDDALYDGSGGSAYTAKLRGSPSLFRHPTRRKWGRRVDALVQSPLAASLTLALMAGDEEVSTATVSVAASPESPVLVKGRVSGRNEVLKAELRSTTAGLKVAGLDLWAAVERRRF